MSISRRRLRFYVVLIVCIYLATAYWLSDYQAREWVGTLLAGVTLGYTRIDKPAVFFPLVVILNGSLGWGLYKAVQWVEHVRRSRHALLGYGALVVFMYGVFCVVTLHFISIGVIPIAG